MRQAAHLMASTLAGSMAAVLCKEQLRTNLAGTVRTIMQSLGPSLDPALLETTVQVWRRP